MSAKDLRQKLLNYPSRKPIPSGIKLDDGTQVFVLRPTIADRSAILKSAGAKPGSDDVDIGKLQVAAAVHMACDEAGTLIFEAADTEAMLLVPIGELIEKIGGFATTQMNVSAAVVEKN